MVIRKYISSDCEHLTDLFYQTVHSVNSKDYTKEQIEAWASGKIDTFEWDRSFLAHYTLVAVINGVIVGFGEIGEQGHLDKLFVHKDFQRQGIATSICDLLESGFNEISTDASITAKPFFLHRGYAVVKEQCVVRNGVALKNYLMIKK